MQSERFSNYFFEFIRIKQIHIVSVPPLHETVGTDKTGIDPELVFWPSDS